MRLTILLLLIISIEPCVAQSYYELCEMGNRKIERKEYKAAAEYFDRAVNAAKSDKEKVFSLSNAGYSRRMHGDLDGAADKYAAALAIDSLSVTLLQQRGNILLEIDSAKAAIECYDKIIAQEPANMDVLYFRAYAYSCVGMYKEGKQDYLKIISKQRDNEKARLGLAILYQKEGKINESLMLLEMLIEEHPDNAEYYITRSNIEREQGQTELALSDVEKALELAPYQIEYHTMKAEILEEAGKKEAAHSYRKKVEKIKSNRQ